MDLSETPLCVLSQAAALVETNSFAGEETTQKVSKEGRNQNLKRTNDKQELPSTPPGKMRLTKSFSPHQSSSLSSDPDEDRDTTDSGDCSSPLDFHAERSSPIPHPLVLPYRDSPNAFVDPVSPLVLCRESAFPLRSDIYALKRDVYQTVYRPVSDYVFDYDQPLDMSKKSGKLDSELSKSPDVQDLSGQQQRPSVITCASALLHTHCNLKDQVHRNCNCSQNEGAHSPVRERSSSSSSFGTSPNQSDSVRPGHRREISSGMCDPVIDEHFRRSLGKDYQEVFSSSSTTSVSITVDDHFAKALGDTWLRLQQKSIPGKENGAGSVSPSRSTPPSSLVQHPQGVVSS